MIRNEQRARGASAVGARFDGEAGPFGVRGEQLDLDGGGRDAVLLAAVAEAAEQRAQDARERFRERRAAAQQRREQLWQARQNGVAQRHSSKLRALADGQDDEEQLLDEDHEPVSGIPDTDH